MADRVNKFGGFWIDVGDVIVAEHDCALVFEAREGIATSWVWIEDWLVINDSKHVIHKDTAELFFSDRVVLKADGRTVVGPTCSSASRREVDKARVWRSKEGWP